MSSERQLRGYIEDLVVDIRGKDWAVGMQEAARAEEALAADPDVVRLREKLSALQVKREQDLKNTEAKKYDLDTAIGRAFDKGATEAISGVVKLIDTMFHVRLTDDGWEWTEEATDE